MITHKILNVWVKVFFSAFTILAFVPSLLFSQWEADVRLTYDASTSYTSACNARCIAANGDTVHVAWYDNRDGNDEIYYKRSIDGGVTWQSDVRLTYDSGASNQPAIAITGNTLHLIWNDDRNGNFEIYYRRSTNGGTTWEAETRLTYNTYISWYASVAIANNIIHLVWTDYRDGNPEIYYKRSTNGGTTWESDIRLSINSQNSFRPAVAAVGLNVYVTWYDARNGDYEIYYKRSSDAGTTWDVETRLTNAAGDSWYSSVATIGTYVHVVWYDARNGTWQVFYKRSTDLGATWGSDILLISDPGNSYHPSVAVSASNVHVAFHDHRVNNYEIYYIRSTDNGSTWETEIRLTYDDSYSYRSSIAVSGSRVHVVWYDGRDGNDEIYYKRNPTGNPGIEEDNHTVVPGAKEYLKIFPSPANEHVVLRYYVSNTGLVSIKIYDALGELVREVFEANRKSGDYSVIWDGRDDQNSLLPSGIYICELTSTEHRSRKPISLIR